MVSTSYSVDPRFLGLLKAAGGAPSNGVIGQIVHDSENTLVGGGYIYHTKFQPTTAGTVGYIHVRILNHNTDTVCVGIFNATGTNLAYGSAVGATDDEMWLNIQLNTTVVVAAATDYYLGVLSSANAGYATDDTAAGYKLWHDGSANTTCGRDVNEENSEVTADVALAIIANNVAGSPE